MARLIVSRLRRVHGGPWDAAVGRFLTSTGHQTLLPLLESAGVWQAYNRDGTPPLYSFPLITSGSMEMRGQGEVAWKQGGQEGVVLRRQQI